MSVRDMFVNMLLKTFFRLLLWMLPLVVLLCTAVPALGGRQPAADEAWDQFGFSYCDLPCFAGVIPGQTSERDAPNLLYRHVPAIDYRTFATGIGYNFWGSIPDQRLAGLVRFNPTQVVEIRLNALIPVERIVDQLGTPDCIVPNTTGDPQRVTVVFWTRSQVSIGAVLGADRQALNLNANTLALWLRAGEPDDCFLRGALPWHGFAPAWNYYSR